MKYSAHELTPMKDPEPGTKHNTKVAEIREGVLRDFVNQDALASWNRADPESPAIEIIAPGPYGDVRRIMQIPADKLVRARSNLARWKHQYGEYPHVGQEVVLFVDEDGYCRFLF